MHDFASNVNPEDVQFELMDMFLDHGADINIVVSNSAPTVSVAQPDGSGDQANESFSIQYSAEDGDDDLGSNL